MNRVLSHLAVLALAASTAACTEPLNTFTQDATQTVAEQSSASECDSDDHWDSLLTQATASEVTMEQIPQEEVDPGALGKAALRVVNDSDGVVAYGVAIILQREQAGTWTNVAQLNTSAGGSPDIIERCDPAYGSELALGLEAPPGGIGPAETYALPPLLEGATHRLIRSVNSASGQSWVLMLEVPPAA